MDRRYSSAIVRLIQFLVSCGTDINHTDTNGRYILWISVSGLNIGTEVNRSCLVHCIDTYIYSGVKPDEQFLRQAMLGMGALIMGNPFGKNDYTYTKKNRLSLSRGLIIQLRANTEFAEGRTSCIECDKCLLY